MKKHIYPLILSVFLITSCATRGPFNVTKIYGDPCPYGERKHPGIDFNIRTYLTFFIYLPHSLSLYDHSMPNKLFKVSV